MRLKPHQQLPPEQLRLTVPGEVMQDLRLYQQYQTETAAVTWEARELATEILRAFLTEGDKAFLRWKKQQGDGAGREAGTAEAQAEVGGQQVANASIKPTLHEA
jgi:hypothetical protein